MNNLQRKLMLSLPLFLASNPASEGDQRLKPGKQAPQIRTTSILGKEVTVPDSDHEFTHVQFERFAGCPVCNLHLHDFIKRTDEVRGVGIREVVFFHSKSKFLKDQGQFPFDVVADPEKAYYRKYKVESSPLAILSPKAWPNLIKGYRFKASGIPDSSPFGQPADFLIDRAGKIIDCHYGSHSSDQWSVDDVLKIAKSESKTTTASHFGVVRQIQSSSNEQGNSDATVNRESMKNKYQSDLNAVRYCNIGASQMAYRQVGAGEPLILIHGYPLSGMTFRKIVPSLAEHFTCYVIDLPGAGDSRWTKETDFGMKGQAESVKSFAEKLGFKSYSVLAHDTGATIARQLAIVDPERVKKLVLIGTEIPHHRPPWIQFFQAFSYVPGSDAIFRQSMQSEKFLRSDRGFGGCFSDLNLLDGDFHELFITPLINSHEQRLGQRYRLRGIDWKLVDSLAQGHSKIKAPVLLIWGQDDPVFPVTQAREMVPQFKDCRGLKVIPNAKLFVQEEQPELVAKESVDFLKN